MTSPTPDAGTTIDGSAGRDDTITASAPDALAPGQPPGGGLSDPSPNIVYTSRSKRGKQAAKTPGETSADSSADSSAGDESGDDAPKRATAKTRKASGS